MLELPARWTVRVLYRSLKQYSGLVWLQSEIHLNGQVRSLPLTQKHPSCCFSVLQPAESSILSLDLDLQASGTPVRISLALAAMTVDLCFFFLEFYCRY